MFPRVFNKQMIPFRHGKEGATTEMAPGIQCRSPARRRRPEYFRYRPLPSFEASGHIRLSKIVFLFLSSHHRPCCSRLNYRHNKSSHDILPIDVP